MNQDNTNVDPSAHLKERWAKVLNQADAFEKVHAELDGLKKKEPDWQKAMRDANSIQEKASVLNLKERWKQQQQQEMYQALAEAHDSKVQAAMNVPMAQRNERFYKNLGAAVLADKRIQQQMKADRQVLKLAFYLKGD